MRVLAIETSSSRGTVALLRGPDLVGETAADVPQRHLEWLAPAIADLLAASGWRPEDVEGVAVSRGPGVFTGLRIGIATAAAWAHTRRVPLAGVSSLQVLAAGVPAEDASEVICPVLDARRGELAFALFEPGPVPRRRLDDMVGPLSALLERLPGDASVTFTGEGTPALAEVVRVRPAWRTAPQAVWRPRAAFAGAIGWDRLAHGDHDDPYLLRPIYARGAGITPSRWTALTEGGEGTPRRAGEE